MSSKAVVEKLEAALDALSFTQDDKLLDWDDTPVTVADKRYRIVPGSFEVAARGQCREYRRTLTVHIAWAVQGVDSPDTLKDKVLDSEDLLIDDVVAMEEVAEVGGRYYTERDERFLVLELDVTATYERTA